LLLDQTGKGAVPLCRAKACLDRKRRTSAVSPMILAAVSVAQHHGRVSLLLVGVMTTGPVGTSQSGAMPRSYQATPVPVDHVTNRTTGRSHEEQDVVERAGNASRS
jgi:hypothetical protein